jgi:hypothetical protein
VDWAVIQGRLGYAPRVTYFQQFAERLLAIEGVPNSSENAGIADSFPETSPYESFDPSYSITNAQTVL